MLILGNSDKCNRVSVLRAWTPNFKIRIFLKAFLGELFLGMTWGWVNTFLVNCSFKWLTPEVSNFPDSIRVPQDVWGIFPRFKMCHKRVYKWLFLTPFISCLIKRYNRNFSRPHQRAFTHTQRRPRQACSVSFHISSPFYSVQQWVQREQQVCEKCSLTVRTVHLAHGGIQVMVDGPTSLFLYIHSRQMKVKAQIDKKNQSCYNAQKHNQQSSLC